MDSITRIKEFIRANFPDWEKVNFSTIDDNINFREDWSDLYKINRSYEDSRDILLLAYERHTGRRLIVYSLCELSIK